MTRSWNQDYFKVAGSPIQDPEASEHDRTHLAEPRAEPRKRQGLGRSRPRAASRPPKKTRRRIKEGASPRPERMHRMRPAEPVEPQLNQGRFDPIPPRASLVSSLFRAALVVAFAGPITAGRLIFNAYGQARRRMDIEKARIHTWRALKRGA